MNSHKLWNKLWMIPWKFYENQASFLCFSHSITIPEKLEYFINKYAEHAHDKWSMDKVKEHHILNH